MSWRSRKYLNGAKGQPCVRCGRNDGTTVACHYTGLRQHFYGKGRGVKPTDIATADLCSVCHAYFDIDIKRKDTGKSEEFLHCILMTQIRRLADGLLTTTR